MKICKNCKMQENTVHNNELSKECTVDIDWIHGKYNQYSCKQDNWNHPKERKQEDRKKTQIQNTSRNWIDRKMREVTISFCHTRYLLAACSVGSNILVFLILSLWNLKALLLWIGWDRVINSKVFQIQVVSIWSYLTHLIDKRQ